MAQGEAKGIDKPRRWLKRARIIALLVLVALLMCHVLWTEAKERALNRKVQAMRAAGESVLLDDFVPPSVPDTDNAALDYLAAANLLQLNTKAWEQLGKSLTSYDVPPPASEMPLVSEVVAQNAAAVDRALQARGKRGADWGVRFTRPAHAVLLPHLNSQRSLSVAMRFAAINAMHKGESGRALVLMDLMLHHAAAIDAPPAFLVTHLVAGGCKASASSALQGLAPLLEVQDRQVATQVIHHLMDDDREGRTLAQALRAERMTFYDTSRYISEGDWATVTSAINGQPAQGVELLSYGVAGTVLRPILADDVSKSLDEFTVFIRSVENVSNWETASARMVPMKPAVGRSRLRLYSSVFLPSLERVIETSCRSRTDCHLAAAALAIRMYAIDHEGQLPQTLESLVPNYLPRLPMDAMDGQPLRYEPQAQPPIIYSVGPDGTDDGGSMISGKWSHLSKDVVIRLTPPKAPVPDPDRAP